MQEHSRRVRPADLKPPRTLFEKLTALISPEPENRAELLEILTEAQERNLIDADALAMIEGVFQVSDLCARDIMVPLAQMDVIDISRPIEEWMHQVLDTAHSRFPAIDDDPDKIVGVLLAKDLLRYYAGETFELKSMLRPVTYIPESKRLNVLLRDFRANRNHMAMVVDEYGAVAGLITIEDVLEQIVGDIDDEYDSEEEDHVIALDYKGNAKRWRVKGTTTLAQFYEETGELLKEASDRTLGEFVVSHLGEIPHKGDEFDWEDLHIEVLRADATEVQLLQIEQIIPEERDSED
ncbi:HlyC/CorC family transporter [Undibacterium luofuense]|uniref:Magnesium and cobalt efflux protein CorC n=1 Tax=Undibacterium luofuense TaxID=2828733 RepID=A0A941DLY4_9BURK|nr:CBS domain-containing protein [Undibacterium luofuense]MBR7781191.1 CBS domain-containing protein [Undibacterium luofuense]